ncbi:MAG: hypothetical protein BWY20_02483 [Spirochaetes bacterium ADurb.Bin215]|nr:MAG: hypothetical protein BWY20_02483 [Spirochaetes bacterium ADurb.Bin215]
MNAGYRFGVRGIFFNRYRLDHITGKPVYGFLSNERVGVLGRMAVAEIVIGKIGPHERIIFAVGRDAFYPFERGKINPLIIITAVVP